jgi:hypothetical protein
MTQWYFSAEKIIAWQLLQQHLIISPSLLIATNCSIIQRKIFKGKFNMKDIGELYWLLNIKIKRDREAKTISLSQDTYIDKILK